MSKFSNYDVIRNPVVTEKSTMASVKVKAVNTLVRKGKVKRFRQELGSRKDVKKAIVTLADGQSIDISTGI